MLCSICNNFKKTESFCSRSPYKLNKPSLSFGNWGIQYSVQETKQYAVIDDSWYNNCFTNDSELGCVWRDDLFTQQSTAFLKADCTNVLVAHIPEKGNVCYAVRTKCHKVPVYHRYSTASQKYFRGQRSFMSTIRTSARAFIQDKEVLLVRAI